MADLQEHFEQAQLDVKALTTKPSNGDLLVLYALYKQATAGEASGAKKPGRFDLVGKAKYDAWNKVAGTSADDAKQRYVDTVARLLAT
ncbi:MAG: acyl-CoA-binding protein [Pseudonocardiales bacterium]|nr:MAG: acyl-CoA-binding protein [Pseudonocardiales bacterium]